ncbi:MAG: hypothetical protein EZS28_031781 [Streblomastix strix]|uniref:Uncharacterized protein n=1 Tax=Streblomastix strix TaxID=222440 RepID=A0A5J4URL1_9EUKA|nr:MAG: hypothetical protein EZS28_031781 [Streblomastix strix]
MSRTDLCNESNQADLIFFMMQSKKLTFEQITPIDQRRLLCWKVHILRSDHQREQYLIQIENLQFHEAVFHIDYKENFGLANERDQESQSFFQKTPVTCLTAVVSKGTEQGDIIKRVITILSSILTHNDVVHWRSDGGPYFRNKQVLQSLLNEDALLPGVDFEINFLEKFNFDKFDLIADYLDIDRFKQFLRFIERVGKFVARPLTGIDQIGEQEYELKSLERNVRGIPKRSTVPIFSS